MAYTGLRPLENCMNLSIGGVVLREHSSGRYPKRLHGLPVHVVLPDDHVLAQVQYVHHLFGVVETFVSAFMDQDRCLADGDCFFCGGKTTVFGETIRWRMGISRIGDRLFIHPALPSDPALRSDLPPGTEGAAQRTVSVRAIIVRINRKLEKDCKRLHVCPESSRWNRDLGRYYMVDCCTNNICGPHIDGKSGLQELARELGVMAEDETIVE